MMLRAAHSVGRATTFSFLPSWKILLLEVAWRGSVWGWARFLSPPPTVPPPTCQEPGGWTWGGQAKSLGPYEIKLSLCHPAWLTIWVCV